MRLIDLDIVDSRLSADETDGERFPISWFRSWLSTQEIVNPLDIAKEVIQYHKDDISRTIGYRLVEADAVPVVRCKDCKFRDTGYCAFDCFDFEATDEAFCSYGERRADNE